MKNVTGIGVFAGITGALLVSSPAQAEVSIPDNIAQKEPVPVNVLPGESTAINFLNNDRVSFLILGDRSRIVYSLNAPTDSGEARSIYLRQIKHLEFPGETTSSKPNLRVVAVNKDGIQKQYEFVVDNTQKHDTDINITPAEKKKKKAPPKPTNAINTELGLASPDDIRTGLKHLLSNGEISPEDPVALTTAEAIAHTLNGGKPLLALAGDYDIPLSVISEFGRAGLAQKAKYRIQAANKKKADALKTVRRSMVEEQIEKFTLDTDLGEANIEDIRFGLSVMRKRGTITEEKAQRISQRIKQAKNGNLSAEDKEELKNVGRLGLAFSSRLRIFGTIN